ncbi:MAG TPA: hypothetical protein VF067_08450 [Sphingomicrobium sp.]
MRKLIISLAAAGAALAIATPAAAQYYPGQYGQPYGNAYGYNNYNYGQVRALQARIDRIEWQINRLDRRDRIRDRSADRLREEANNIERRLRHAARDGMSPWEAQDIQVRIARLEQRVQYSMARGYGRYGYNNGYNGYGYNNNEYRDHDRDGRDDRYEDDQGQDHDD